MSQASRAVKPLGSDDFGKGAKNLELDYAIHACSIRRLGNRGGEVGMIQEGELAEGKEKLITPSVEITGVDFEAGRNSGCCGRRPPGHVGFGGQRPPGGVWRHGGRSTRQGAQAEGRGLRWGNAGRDSHPLLGGACVGDIQCLHSGNNLSSSSCVVRALGRCWRSSILGQCATRPSLQRPPPHWWCGW